MSRPALLVLALLLTHCGDGAQPATNPAVDSGGGTADVTVPIDSTSPADTPSTGQRTLDTCTTSIAADAPEFFKKFFRCVTITTTDTSVVIATQDLPPHPSAYYETTHPNYVPFDTSRPGYKQNPNRIQAQAIQITIPKAPLAKGITITAAMVDGAVGTNGDEYGLGAVGVALDSVALFNPLAAPGMNIDDERFTFDNYEAHPQMTGAYHYHTASPGPLEVLQKIGVTTSTVPGSAAVEVFGIMCDGTVVLGCKELDGAAPAGTLDAQGGHLHDIADKAGTKYFEGRYHTHVCPSATGSRKYTPEIQYYGRCVTK